MTDPKIQFEPGYRFSYAQGRAMALEELLKRHGLAVRAGSMLERATLSVFDMVDRYQNYSPDRKLEDIRPPFRELIGLTELAALILSVEEHPSFPTLLKHLRLLNEGIAIQNTRASATDQATNKVFELLVATLAMHCGVAVELDDPEESKGDNPDVLVTINGLRWGFACKVLHSPHPQTFLDRLEEGIEQIEDSEATIGTVVFNLKNVIDHDAYWSVTNMAAWESGAEPEFGCYTNEKAPFEQLLEDVRAVGTRMRAHIDKNTAESLFAGKKATPGYLLWGHTVCGVLLEGLPVVSSVRTMIYQALVSPKDEEHKVFSCLHQAVFTDHRGDPL